VDLNGVKTSGTISGRAAASFFCASSCGELAKNMLLPTGYSQELVLWEGNSGDTLAPRGVRERRIVEVRGEKTHHALGTRRLGTLHS
jgi:hypothetical protein